MRTAQDIRSTYMKDRDTMSTRDRLRFIEDEFFRWFGRWERLREYFFLVWLVGESTLSYKLFPTKYGEYFRQNTSGGYEFSRYYSINTLGIGSLV